MLQKFDKLFREKVGELKGTEAILKMKDDSAPWYFKPRSVPYAYRAKVEQELKRLEAENIIEPVRFANWDAPIIRFMKADVSIRGCGVNRLTTNKAAVSEKYPLPRVEEI